MGPMLGTLLPAPMLAGLADAVRAIGSGQFHVRLLDALSGLAAWHNRMVMRYPRYAAPDFLFEEGVGETVKRLYRAGYYRVDPYYRSWKEEGRSGVYTLREVLPAGIDETYLYGYLPQTGCVDDIGLILPAIGGSAIMLFWENRDRAFTADEAEAVRAAFPLALALHEEHLAKVMRSLGQKDTSEAPARAYAVVDRERRIVYRSAAWHEAGDVLDEALGGLLAGGQTQHRFANGGLLHAERLGPDFAIAPEGLIALYEPAGPAAPPLSFHEAVASFFPDALTPREREIVSLVLSGSSNAAIARRLGLTEGAVRNHRLRLYGKLGIGAERELFKLFVDHLVARAGV